MSLTTAIVNESTELESLRKQATTGDASAQLQLAIRYRDGVGIEKNDHLSLQWAHQAADQGHADAQDFVGFAYLRGNVIERNTTIAFGYFKAAAASSGQAAFNLGQCYYGAQGIEQDVPKALDSWSNAAEAGHGRAAACAAMAYLTGANAAAKTAKAA